MMKDIEAPDDVLSIGSSTPGSESDAEHGSPRPQVAPSNSRGRREDEGSQMSSSSGSQSPAAVANLSPRDAKQARPSASPSASSSQQGSEEGEIDDSASDVNPRSVLENGKQTMPLNGVADVDRPRLSTSPAPGQISRISPASPDFFPDKDSAAISSQAAGIDCLSGASMPQDPPTFVVGSSSLGLPSLSAKKEGSWLARFKDWVQVFCHYNKDSISEITQLVAMDAFCLYIEDHSGLRPTKKKAAKQAVKKAESSRAIHNLIESIKSGMVIKSDEAPAASTNHQASAKEGEAAGASNESVLLPHHVQASAEVGEVRVTRAGVPTGEEELRQQQRYFPSATDPSRMCLLCGGEGHKALHCSRSKCRFCSSYDHWDFCCDSIRKRCKKCRQLGHQTATCTEKLVLTKDEGLSCAYCHSPDHLEGNCTEIWRSFQPDAQTVCRVVSLPSSCSVCGGRDHFSGDCRQRQGVSANPTWSLRNLNLYIDPKCESRCIEDTRSPRMNHETLQASEPKIRGHTARNGNVHYFESDDSEVEFLGKTQPKKRKAGSGQIRMSSNIQFPQTMGGARVSQSQPADGAPPLPPGPPPPRPPQISPSLSGTLQYRGQVPLPPPPPLHSLPTKPPASPWDFRGVPPPAPSFRTARPGTTGQNSNQGRGGGRGGRGGRGRGRWR